MSVTASLNGVPVIFIKAFSTGDAGTIVEFVRRWAGDGGGRVLFVDTPATTNLVAAVRSLVEDGFDVVFRDHHGLEGEPTDDRQRAQARAALELKELLGEKATTARRSAHPACSSLVDIGEFGDCAAIVADPDPDGLSAACKATGIVYDDANGGVRQFDIDAAIMDGPLSGQLAGSPLSQLLVKGFTTVTPASVDRPRSDLEMSELFALYVAAVQGNCSARTQLERLALDFQSRVEAALSLGATAVEVVPGALFVDVTGQQRYDPVTLTGTLERQPGCRLTIILKDQGPIARVHGRQVTLSVVKTASAGIDLRRLLPDGFAPSDNEEQVRNGVISNVSFLLHVSETVYREVVFPGLAKLFQETCLK